MAFSTNYHFFCRYIQKDLFESRAQKKAYTQKGRAREKKPGDHNQSAINTCQK